MNIYILLAGKPAVCELGNQQQMDHVQQLCEITKRVAGKSPAWLDDVLMFPSQAMDEIYVIPSARRRS